MEDKKNGYKSKHYDFPTKRYCQTLDLKDDPELIKEYRKRHGQECYWPEIGEGIKSVGILEMEIYLCGNRLFMIVETPLDFDWDTAFSRLAGLPVRLSGKNICLFFNRLTRVPVPQRNGS